MTVYVCITLWIAVCAIVRRLYREKAGVEPALPQKRLAPYAFALVTMGVVIFFIGLRSAGADTHAYISGFNSSPSGLEALFSPGTYEDIDEPLFEAFGVLCKTIYPNYHLYLFAIALISGTCVAVAMCKNTAYPGWCMLVFMLAGTFGWMINGIRQFLVVSILFACSGLLMEKKTVPYLVVVAILSLVHKSAIVMLFVPFLVQGPAWNKRTLAFLAVGAFAVVATSAFLGLVSSATEGTGLSTNDEILSSDNGSSFVRTLIYAAPLVLAFVKRDEIEKADDPYINLCVNMTFLCVVFSLIANVTSGVYYGRLPIYFSLYGLMLLVWVINNAYGKLATALNLGMTICYTYLFFTESNGYYYSDLLFGGQIIPAW